MAKATQVPLDPSWKTRAEKASRPVCVWSRSAGPLVLALPVSSLCVSSLPREGPVFSPEAGRGRRLQGRVLGDRGSLPPEGPGEHGHQSREVPAALTSLSLLHFPQYCLLFVGAAKGSGELPMGQPAELRETRPPAPVGLVLRCFSRPCILEDSGPVAGHCPSSEGP